MKHPRGKGSMTTETGVGVRQSHAKECWLPPEAGRGSLETSEGAWPWFGTFISARETNVELLAFRTHKDCICVILSHPHCGDLLPQP